MRKRIHVEIALLILATSGARSAFCDKNFVVHIPVESSDGLHIRRGLASYSVGEAKGVVQVKVGDVAPEYPQIPFLALSAALAHDKASRFFRLSWFDSGVGRYREDTLLYDRVRQKLKVFHHDFGGEKYSGSISATVLANVNDRMIRQAATGFSDDYTRARGNGSFLERLARNGGRVRWKNSREIR